MRGWLYEQLWRSKSRLTKLGIANVLDFLSASQYWTPSQIQDLRDRKLHDIVSHAYNHIPFYRRLLDERGVKPQNIEGIHDLPKLPVVTKEMLRNHWRELRARDLPDCDVYFSQTGGTTGVPMRIARDRASDVWGTACYVRGLGWAGLTLREKRVRLFGGTLGTEPARKFDGLRRWFRGELFLPAFELGPHNFGDCAAQIRRSRAQFLIGYASACHSLAMLSEAEGGSLTFTAVFPTAELCPASWAEAIARVFSAKVLPYYGCGEVNSLAYCCSEGVYHICDEHAAIEVEDEAGKISREGDGAFVITDLDNRAMPIIRYRNGDAGQVAGPGCRCGRSLGRILRLDGRVNDMLVTTSGSKFSGVIATHTFRLIDHVESYQVLQRAPGHATIRIVRGHGYDPRVEEPKIYKIFRRHLGPGSDVVIEYVTSVDKTPAGKARFVINEYLNAAGAER